MFPLSCWSGTGKELKLSTGKDTAKNLGKALRHVARTCGAGKRTKGLLKLLDVLRQTIGDREMIHGEGSGLL